MNNLIIDVGIIKKKEREGGRTKKNDCEATKNYFSIVMVCAYRKKFYLSSPIKFEYNMVNTGEHPTSPFHCIKLSALVGPLVIIPIGLFN